MGFLDSINPVNLVKDVVQEVESLAEDVSSGNLLGALEDMTQLASEISGSSELTSVAESVAGALGLPKEVTDAIKIATGAATGDVAAALSGAIGELNQATQGAGATSYCPCQDPSTAGMGYAQPAASPETTEELRMLEYLQQHFDDFEKCSPNPFHIGDHRIGTEEFQAISDSNDAPAEMKKVARYFLENPSAMADIAKSDGGIVPQDIGLAIETCQQRLTNPATTSSSGTSGCGSVDSGDAVDPEIQAQESQISNDIAGILNDPTMSIEEKLMAILMKLDQEADLEMQSDMKQLSNLQQQHAAGTGKEKPTAADNQSQEQLKNQMENVNFKLQQQVDRKKALESLMSNVEKAFNDMAMTAIGNLGR